MAGDGYFYSGADYGFDPNYSGFSRAYSEDISGNVSLATDARVANQLKTTTEKLSTGATAVEISTISQEVFETIPLQHFEELNRLRKVVGNVELTLHAPLVEPTGITKRGWDSYEREQAERQMKDAIEKSHRLNPKGNVVTTFHASVAGLPSETAVWEEKETKEGKKIVRVPKEVIIMNNVTGDFQQLPLKPSYLEKEEEEKINEEYVSKKIENINSETWHNLLHKVAYDTEIGESRLQKAMEIFADSEDKYKVKPSTIFGIYKEYTEGKSDKLSKAIKDNPNAKGILQEGMHVITQGDIYLRGAYDDLRKMFDQAYKTLEESRKKDELKKLNEFRDYISPKLKKLKDPSHIAEFAAALKKGVDVLKSVEVPIYKPIREFAIDKSSETFSNVALHSFKKFGENSPIISIENPPAGMGMLTTGDDLRDLVKETREKFISKAVKEGISREQAKREAEKLIGVTWDVGHINQLRKYGAGEKELIEEAKKVAPYAKHMHLSDNFGLENVELPMGMGNVPPETVKEILKHNKNLKKVVEVGNWYQHFQTTPFGETLEHFNSPIYAMKNASYWGPQGYFIGQGAINPEIHHSMYGSGFANLPIELGGQMAGRSRVSGAPLD